MTHATAPAPCYFQHSAADAVAPVTLRTPTLFKVKVPHLSPTSAPTGAACSVKLLRFTAARLMAYRCVPAAGDRCKAAGSATAAPERDTS